MTEKGPQISEWIFLRPWICSLDLVSTHLSTTPQVLEFTGGILALVDKAKTTLETMATEAATESSLRSGSLLSPSLFSGASRADPAEHTDHRPYLRSSPKGTRILFPFITH